MSDGRSGGAHDVILVNPMLHAHRRRQRAQFGGVAATPTAMRIRAGKPAQPLGMRTPGRGSYAASGSTALARARYVALGLVQPTGGDALRGVDSSAVSDLVDRYVRFVRSVPLPVLIGIVWVKGFVFGWWFGRRG